MMVSARFVQFMWTERRVVVEHGSVAFDGERRTANQNANAVSTDPACPVWDLHQVNRRHHLWYYSFGHQQGGLLAMEDAPAG
ncbi:MAG: hypothetical protein ACRDTH_05720 [Pseudonocardiaceae bacterium]